MGKLILIVLCVMPVWINAEQPAQTPKELWQLDIEGNKVAAASDLREAISATPSSHLMAIWPLSLLRSRHEFDPVAFKADEKRIEHFYQRMGYYQARVERAEVKPCSDAGRVCAHILIREGQPTAIASVVVKVAVAEPAVSPNEMLRVFGMEAGDVFDHGRYSKAKQTVLDYLRERSYPKPEIKGEARYDEKSNNVRLRLEIAPGTAASVGYIRFQGLDEILPEDAMARLPIKTGMKYDPRLFDDAQDLLSDLDVFRSIDLALVPRAGAPHIVDVTYHIHERLLKTLQFGAGIRVENSRQELRGRAEWTNRNFYHHLRHFNVRFEPRYAVLPSIFRPQQSGPLGNFDISMRHPAFMSPRQDLRTSIGFDSEFEQGYRWYGPRVGGNIERHFSRKFTFTGGYAFRYLTFFDVDLGAATNTASVPVELLFANDYRLGYFNEYLKYDDRDDIADPHRGGFAQLGLQESSQVLGSGFTYFRISPDLRYYIPMTRRATLASRVFAGRLAPLIGSTSPITERFYGGGANDHRGFSYHRLSPQTLTADGRSVPVGGNFEFLFSAEERVNLTRLADSWLIGAIFFDAGDVVNTPGDFDIRQLHYAVGPGLRYNTPIGLIRADAGFRLNRLGDRTDGRPNPDPGQRFAIHVSLGEAF